MVCRNWQFHMSSSPVLSDVIQSSGFIRCFHPSFPSPSLPVLPDTIPRLACFPVVESPNWTLRYTTMVSSKGRLSVSALLKNPILEIFSFAYVVFQTVLNYVFSPVPPPPSAAATSLPQKRIAVIGAGLTGVSSAAHCVGHGFDVQLFEARSEEKGLGGIWSVRYSSSPNH